MRTPILVSLLTLSVFGVVGCDSSMEPSAKPTVDATLGQPFTLEPGQTAVLAEASLTLTFQGVIEDGRCPIDAVCIAAGQAATAVHATQDRSAAVTLTLILPAVPEGVPYAGVRVHAESLLPAPVSDHLIRPEDYRLQLLVDRP